jgi:hypothetical protein
MSVPWSSISEALGKRVWEKDIDAVGVLFFCDCCVFFGVWVG